LRIEDVETKREFQFSRDIGGIFTRQGCNGSGCHGGVKGRGGFKLSAGVLNPKDDYEWIVQGGGYQVLTAEVKGDRIPRVNLKDPAKSLILLKATGSIPHGGGKRFPIGSQDYNTILKWVTDGAPYGPEASRENRVVRLEVFPKITTLDRDGQQRLLITAHFADGRTEDFSGQALCAVNDKSVAAVSGCLVKAGRLGETSVLVRAAGLAASATVGVIGPPLAAYSDPAGFNFIDEFIFEKLRRFRTPPSGLSSDQEFLRRVCLDLTGTLPPPARAREFLASKDPAKRSKLIDTLMASPEFVDYWTYRFDDLFRVGVFPNGINLKWSQMYADWVRNSIASNKPYDQMARERIAAQGYDGPTRHYLPYDVIGPPGETMAEEFRVFFGRRLDCAQCHNHPYEAWSQDQFWGLAAFFSRVFKMGDTGAEYVVFDHPANEAMGNGDVNGSIKLYHPRTKAEVKPALLDGTVVESAGRENPRKVLANWMVSHPYFAEAAANRIWSYLLGRGLVDPVDDFRSTNPPSHPELLDRLASEFRAHKYDLRYLIRTIATSRTYQLSGRTLDSNKEDRTNYSHALPRALDAEVMLDAITAVTGVPEVFTTGISDAQKDLGQAPAGTRAITLRQTDLYYSRFLDIYGRPNRLTLPERSGKSNLNEALHMLAGAAYQEKLAAPGSRLRKLLDEGRPDDQIIEEFYLAAYSRLPERDESDAIRKLIASHQNHEDALRDFVWAILCSREFAENH
ncbi:MAG TPA: DUF1549 and DUF1553 domain-containing protein, partial [Bryobacteraceae bacterium]|nr:DUF1549 and DUF1553 domain-containing protein [Bryobacteraceae bacterium]